MTNTEKPTPGPWFIDKMQMGEWPIWTIDGDAPIHCVGASGYKANAILMAASWELLDALKEAKKEIEAWRTGLNTLKGYKNFNDAKVGSYFSPIHIINDAIAKAEGK